MPGVAACGKIMPVQFQTSAGYIHVSSRDMRHVIDNNPEVAGVGPPDGIWCLDAVVVGGGSGGGWASAQLLTNRERQVSIMTDTAAYEYPAIRKFFRPLVATQY